MVSCRNFWTCMVNLIMALQLQQTHVCKEFCMCAQATAPLLPPLHVHNTTLIHLCNEFWEGSSWWLLFYFSASMLYCSIAFRISFALFGSCPLFAVYLCGAGCDGTVQTCIHALEGLRCIAISTVPVVSNDLVVI
jgi:hypothetical protein